MSVRRRMVRERVERDRKWQESWDEQTRLLTNMKTVVDEAIAEGLARLTPQEFGDRLHAVAARSQADGISKP